VTELDYAPDLAPAGRGGTAPISAAVSRQRGAEYRRALHTTRQRRHHAHRLAALAERGQISYRAAGRLAEQAWRRDFDRAPFLAARIAAALAPRVARAFKLARTGRAPAGPSPAPDMPRAGATNAGPVALRSYLLGPLGGTSDTHSTALLGRAR
jgi:hypothetical protein